VEETQYLLEFFLFEFISILFYLFTMEKLERDRILQALDDDVEEEIREGISSDEGDEALGDTVENAENVNTDTEQSSFSDDENNTFFNDYVRSTYSYHTSEDDSPLSVRASSFFLWERWYSVEP